jgi:hypothetical protein
MRNNPSEPVHPDVLFEPSDIDVRRILLMGFSIVATVAIVVSLLYFYFDFLMNRRATLSSPPLPMNLHGDVLPPQPRIQASPSQDLRDFRVYEDAVLEKYGWIDKSKGRVAIPIDRAMELLAQRGIPPQKAPADLNLFEPREGTRLTGFEGKVRPEPR